MSAIFVLTSPFLKSVLNNIQVIQNQDATKYIAYIICSLKIVRVKKIWKNSLIKRMDKTKELQHKILKETPFSDNSIIDKEFTGELSIVLDAHKQEVFRLISTKIINIIS